MGRDTEPLQGTLAQRRGERVEHAREAIRIGDEAPLALRRRKPVEVAVGVENVRSGSEGRRIVSASNGKMIPFSGSLRGRFTRTMPSQLVASRKLNSSSRRTRSGW